MQNRSLALLTVLTEAQNFATQLPLERRANLYRGLAEICAHAGERTQYIALAEKCDALRQQETEMQFRLALEGFKESK